MIRVGSAEDHGLALDVIRIDGGTQSRATLNDQVVNDYAEAIKAGATFPPIVVFYDGKKHWLADGFHRFHAYQKAGKSKVAADVRQGTRRDAILHSVGANETHGLRRTRDDKRRAVLTLLNDAEWGKWTDREIGRACQVHHETVGKLRPVTGETASERTYTTKHGTTATMKTAGINADRAKPVKGEKIAPFEGGAETKEITPETAAQPLRHKAFEGGAEPVSAKEEFTPPRTGYDLIVEAWTAATAEDREAFIAYLRVGGFIPEISRRPASPAGKDGSRGIPRDDARGAGRGAEAPHIFPQSTQAVTVPETPAPPPAGDRAGAAVPPPSAAPVQSRKPVVLRPHCLHPDLCAGSGSNHCYACKKALAEGEAA